MLVRWIRSDAVFLGEGGVRTFAETVARVNFAVLSHLEPDGKLLLQSLEFLPGANAVGAIPNGQQPRVAGC